MLINLRNALMTGKRLPYDAEVEYLESTGTQWIDTGVVPDFDTNVRFVGAYNFHDTYACITGARTGNINPRDGRYIPFGSTPRNTDSNARMVMAGSDVIFPYVYDGNLHEVIFNDNAHRCFFDDSLIATWTSGNIVIESNTLYIFGANGYGTEKYLSRSKVASYQVYQGGVLVRDYIPVRKGTVGYLYDRVSGKMKPFGNMGTGDFVLGPDVVPVEYIESHGTEYIDTRFVPTSLTRFDVDMQFTSMPTTYWGCGIYAMSPVRRFNLGASTTKFNLSYGDNNDISASVDTARHSYSLDAANLRWAFDSLNGSYAATVSSAFPDALLLFACSNGRGGAENKLSGRIFSCNIWEDGDPVRTFSPVRVGTDATSWEGAMMDVLTRRIYRNAGTGAFTYGNDLKYPIPAE